MEKMEKRIDEDLLEWVREKGGRRYRLWEPTFPLAVLGRSSRSEEEIWEENCEADRIRVIKRLGGGKSVLLSPGMLVLSLAAGTGRFQGHLYYAQAINQIIEKTLTSCGVGNIYQKGVSDLALEDRKILGCCLFVSRGRGQWIVFYQGSLLFQVDLSLMGRYLKHPPWEPEYRRGRGHHEFLTTLREEGYSLGIMEFASHLAASLDERIPQIFGPSSNPAWSDPVSP